MAVEIKVPSVGESITQGVLARWLKADGAVVAADEPLIELETDKATTEIAAPAAGTLRVEVPEGTTVQIGAVVGRIEAATVVPAKPPSPSVSPAVAEAPMLSPAARRMAEEEAINPHDLTGSGRGGRVIKEDVQAVVESRKPVEVPDNGPITRPTTVSGSRITRQKMSAIRQRIAERLLTAQNSAAAVTTFNEADLSAVMELRDRYKEPFKEKHGVSLGFMSFFVKAAVEALKAYPLVNARIDGSDIVHQHFYDIGVAVSSEKGLMVPVVRDADTLGFAGIEKAIASLAKKARDGRISVDDLQGGTFTITNGGIFGSLLSTPMLNAPQTAILGMHSIQKRPVVIDDQVVVRPMMYLALTYDHRLIDGREAVLFLGKIKSGVEHPERLMLEV